ncbi:MAG: endo-1,4-beta-xylanase [Planctomycetota bacterium]
MIRVLFVLIVGIAVPQGALAMELEAQAFPVKTCGAAQGRFWNLWTHGYAAAWIRFPASTAYRIEVEAFGQAARKVWPEMRVTVDLKPVARIFVATEKAKTFSWTVEVGEGIRRFSIFFLNDYRSPDRREDRNLYLGRIVIRPVRGGGDPAQAAAPDWRKEADRRIARIRQGDLVLRVVGREGKPVPHARIRVTLARHAFPFGCAVSSGFVQGRWDREDLETYARLFKELFNHAVHENALKWHGVNRKGPEPNFLEADRILGWCGKNGISMRGHCIFWANERCVPAFARALDPEGLRAAAFRRIEEVLSRYRGTIREFDLNNEMIHVNYFARRLGEGFRVEMFKKAHAVDPRARMYVNDFNILTGGDLERYVKHIEDLMAAGAPVGGIGCQGHFGGATMDPHTVRMALDRLAVFELPIKITEFDIDTANEGRQAIDVNDFYRLCFSHPSVAGILMWGFWEGAHWRPRAALYTRDWREKPAADAYRRLVLKEWKTEAKGATDASGSFRTRAFYGSYRVRIEPEGGAASNRFIRFPRDQSGIPILVEIR